MAENRSESTCVHCGHTMSMHWANEDGNAVCIGAVRSSLLRDGEGACSCDRFQQEV